jgi:hypothetical protein
MKPNNLNTYLFFRIYHARYMIFSYITFCFFLIECQLNDKRTNLKTLIIKPNSENGDVRIFDAENNLLFSKEERKWEKEDFFMYVIYNPVWDSKGLIKDLPPEFFHLNYYALMKRNSDTINTNLINLLLKKLSINQMIDFKTEEGQVLAKIILSIKYGDLEHHVNEFRIATVPKMPFSRNASDQNEIINIDTIVSLQKSGYFTPREFLDIIKDQTIIEQFSSMANSNGTVMLCVLTGPSGKHNLNINKILMYYQFIENNILQIGEVDMNVYRKHSFD